MAFYKTTYLNWEVNCTEHGLLENIQSRESLLKGELSLQVTSFQYFLLPAFYTENIFMFFYKTSYLNREVNCTEPDLLEITQNREPLLKGKDLYNWPPCTNYLWLAAFNTEAIVLFFNKTTYLNREVNCTEPDILEITQTREALLKRKDHYSWPHCTNYLWSAAFNTEAIVLFFNKTTYLNREVNCTEPDLLENIQSRESLLKGELSLQLTSLQYFLSPALNTKII